MEDLSQFTFLTLPRSDRTKGRSNFFLIHDLLSRGVLLSSKVLLSSSLSINILKQIPLEHPDVNMSKEASVVKVPMHDLAKEIMSNYRISDYVVIKMDIEGKMML